MTYEQVRDAIDGLMAYDLDATDSGIKDEALRARVKAWLHDAPDTLVMSWLTDYAHDLTGSGSQYTLEDVRALIEWLRDYMEYDV
jgi:hypothetical protein